MTHPPPLHPSYPSPVIVIDHTGIVSPSLETYNTVTVSTFHITQISTSSVYTEDWSRPMLPVEPSWWESQQQQHLMSRGSRRELQILTANIWLKGRGVPWQAHTHILPNPSSHLYVIWAVFDMEREGWLLHIHTHTYTHTQSSGLAPRWDQYTATPWGLLSNWLHFWPRHIAGCHHVHALTYTNFSAFL